MNPQFLQAISSELPPTVAPCSWLTAYEGSTDYGPLRGWLEEQCIVYVLAVARPSGRRADVLAPAGTWYRPSRGSAADLCPSLGVIYILPASET
jgi:hypothetical protein